MPTHIKLKNDNNETVKAGCVVVNEKGEVLLVNAEEDVWAFPKGHAESGETLEQVAVREAKEETGWEVSIIKRLPDVTYTHGETGELVRVAMFLAKPIRMSGAAEPEMQPRWFSVAEARTALYPNLVSLLDEANRNVDISAPEMLG